MNDEQYLLASVYLDGELTAPEIAVAEADPTVMAGVEQMRAVRAAMRNIDPPLAASRESAITAALAEFDSARTTPVPTAGVVDYRPRPAYTRWLGVAAAVVAVGVLGVVIAQSVGSDNDEAADTDAAALDVAGAQPESASTQPALASPAAESATALSVVADSSAAASAEESSAAESASAAEDAASLTQAPTAEASGDSASIESTRVAFDPAVPIVGEFELAQVGAELLDRAAKGSLPPTPNTRCGADADEPLEPLDEGLYQGDDAVVVPILITVDRDARQIVALDPESCGVVVVTFLP